MNLLRWLLLLPLLGLCGSIIEAAEPETWQIVKSPDVWKKPPKDPDGLSWYRAFVQVPGAWRGRNVELFVEPSDAAVEVFFNGKSIGSAGAFPPFFRSGLGGNDRHFVPTELIHYDGLNVVALRYCDQDGRTGFNLAAPVLFGGEQAVRLAGLWQVRLGDQPAWARFDETMPPTGVELFTKLESAEAIAATLKKLDNDAGPRTPEESLAQFTVTDGLEIRLVVAEPEVRQPLSLKWDHRGRLWVVQFIQYPDPAGLKMVSRDKFLRSVYDRVPPAPPNHFPGLDKITIHEDTNGDGRLDPHRTFVEGLSLVSSIAFDRDGLWVLNPPYLLFYPDRDHDDVPDGPPVVHLEGFGIEDSHSIANSLRWGPDGWLYGAQGSTVSGAVRTPGAKQTVNSLGQCIWRYDPRSRRYEIVAEGGGNAFGLEIDAAGRMFSGHNGGNTRGFHYLPGGYYRKGFEKHGALSNPYTFGFFEAMGHANVPRFTHTFAIAEADAWPDSHRGNLFAVAPLQGHVIRATLERDRSSLKTRDLDFPVTSADTWFRPVDIQLGPDGALYIADLYEQRIDHASHYQGRIDRQRGRVWQLSPRGTGNGEPFDYARMPLPQVVQRLVDPNRWHRQTALEILAARGAESTIPALRERMFATNNPSAVNDLWALGQLGGLDEATIASAFDHPEPLVRAWLPRLLIDQGRATSELVKQLEDHAPRETDVAVRCQWAAAIRHLPAADSLRIVRALLVHDADVDDIHQPLLLWWGIEAHMGQDRDRVVDLLADAELWQRPLVREALLERIMRRLATTGSRGDLLACARLLELAPDRESAARLLAGFEKAFEGRSLGGLPEELISALAKVGGGSRALRVRQGDPVAVREALTIVADGKAAQAERLQYVQLFAETKQPDCVAVLLNLVASDVASELRSAALGALQAYDDERIGRDVTALLPKLDGELRDAGLTLLARRRPWVVQLLTAIDQGSLPPQAVPIEQVRQFLFHPDPQISMLVMKHWGTIQGSTSAELHALIEQYKELLAAGSGNPYTGRKLFQASCGKCHVLFNEGGRIGPDLTAYKRDDLHVMLVNVVNPSAQIREGFENFIIVTADGRALNGFIADQDARVVVLRGIDGQSVVVQRSEIEEMTPLPRSIMPEGLLKDMTPQQIRDLFAYLRSTQPLAAGR